MLNADGKLGGMKRWRGLLVGVCLGWVGVGWAAAGGAGQPVQPPPRTPAVVTAQLASPGVFVCADGQRVFAEVTGDQLRLTRRGEVFMLPKLAQPGGYGENGVSWVSTEPESAELTLGRTQPVTCRAAALPAGPTQGYRCAQGLRLAVTLHPDSVVIALPHPGVAARTTTILPQVRSASGATYQHSRWTWRTKGNGGQLEGAGQGVARECRLQ